MITYPRVLGTLLINVLGSISGAGHWESASWLACECKKRLHMHAGILGPPYRQNIALPGGLDPVVGYMFLCLCMWTTCAS